MANLSKHAEWLSLIEVSGPFISIGMLDQVFPQGLDAIYPALGEEGLRESVSLKEPLLMLPYTSSVEIWI